jgi:multimeric flavodoxin WrbA
MKAVLFNTSPRSKGNTYQMLKTVEGVLKESKIETKVVQLGKKPVNGCHACYKCYSKKNKKCVLKDKFNDHFRLMLQSEIIVIGSPTYVADLTPEAKALIDRACIVNRANGGLLQRKIGAAVVPVRRAGSVHAFDSINHFFLISEMIIPGSIYWNMSVARNPGDYKKDEEGVKTMNQLGKNIVWLAKKIYK